MELPELIESQEWCALNIEEEIAYEKAVYQVIYKKLGVSLEC